MRLVWNSQWELWVPSKFQNGSNSVIWLGVWGRSVSDQPMVRCQAEILWSVLYEGQEGVLEEKARDDRFQTPNPSYSRYCSHVEMMQRADWSRLYCRGLASSDCEPQIRIFRAGWDNTATVNPVHTWKATMNLPLRQHFDEWNAIN